MLLDTWHAGLDAIIGNQVACAIACNKNSMPQNKILILQLY
jgi:hypothetical protein